MSSRALIRGGTEPALLGLSDTEANAVVQLRAWRDGELSELCTGVLIAPEWVLSAGHCKIDLEGQLVRVLFGPDGDCPLLSVEPERILSLEDFDLQLVRLPSATDPALASPIGPAFQTDLTGLVGQALQLVGFGRTETEAFGSRLFLAEALSRVEDEWLVVDGAGRSGACVGDSGAPLLYRCGDGAPCVLGILSVGSSSCTGEDFFSRLDLVQDWLTDHTGVPSPARERPCGGISAEGRCFGKLAVHCGAEQQLEVEECDQSRPCRWVDSVAGFRCYATPADDCGDLTQLGLCDGTKVQRCESGTLTTLDCAAEGLECMSDPISAVANCL